MSELLATEPAVPTSTYVPLPKVPARPAGEKPETFTLVQDCPFVDRARPENCEGVPRTARMTPSPEIKREMGNEVPVPQSDPLFEKKSCGGNPIPPRIPAMTKVPFPKWMCKWELLD